MGNTSEQHSLQFCIQSFVAQLVACGLRHVVISPGSRNAPLIQAFVNSQIQVYSMVDERSAGFLAYGMAKQMMQPVAVVCTSGTAAANYLPASIEAYYLGVPVMFITADRPPELIDQWDGQCIRQKGLFSQHIKAEFETPANYEESALFNHAARNAFEAATLSDQGPVHVNVPLREPIYERLDSQPQLLPIRNIDGPHSDSRHVDILIQSIRDQKRILLLNGANTPNAESVKVPDNIPVLSDVISNRMHHQNITVWDGMLTSMSGNWEQLQPEVLITTGKMVLSKALKKLLRNYPPKKHLHIGFENWIGDPFHSSPQQLHIAELDLWRILENAKMNTDYLQKWTSMSDQFQKNVLSWPVDEWNEMLIVQKLLGWLPKNSCVHLSNSMSVRYVSYVNQRKDLQIFSNRGTSGIDGCTSTAVGAALQVNGPCTFITGDIAFFYDINGLWIDQYPQNLAIIVLNNGGGEIFNLIDGPDLIPESLPYQITPHQRSIEKVASQFGLDYLCAENFGELHKCLDQMSDYSKPFILEVKTNPEDNKAFYQRFKNNTL